MALIRDKPHGIATDDYTRHLAERWRLKEKLFSENYTRLEKDTFYLRQKLAVMVLRNGKCRSSCKQGISNLTRVAQTFPQVSVLSLHKTEDCFSEAESSEAPQDKSLTIADYYKQHWTFLESYLTLTSMEKDGSYCTPEESDDAEELALESAEKLFTSIHRSPPIGAIEMELCTKALAALASICDAKQRHSASLCAAATKFVRKALAAILASKPFQASKIVTSLSFF